MKWVYWNLLCTVTILICSLSMVISVYYDMSIVFILISYIGVLVSAPFCVVTFLLKEYENPVR